MYTNLNKYQLEISPALPGWNLISPCNRRVKWNLSRLNGLKFHSGKPRSCNHHVRSKWYHGSRHPWINIYLILVKLLKELRNYFSRIIRVWSYFFSTGFFQVCIFYLLFWETGILPFRILCVFCLSWELIH